jgi:hypothetical protein
MGSENMASHEIATQAIKAFGSKSRIRLIAPPHAMPDNIFEPDDTLFRLLEYFPQISMAVGMRMEAACRKIMQ